jgi:nitrate/TMAO reductase-like tetraheme cytochrome c subunit
MTSRKEGAALKKWFFAFMLLAVPAFLGQPAVAQKTTENEAKKESKKESAKESHKEYAGMQIGDCNSCHKGEGIAPTHDADWVRSHRLLANQGEKNCGDCHDQSFCLDCHQGGGIDAKLSTRNYRSDYTPKSHRTDWLEIHPIKALDNPQTCYRCHDKQYCVQCHDKFKPQQLQFLSHRRQFRDIQLKSIGPNHANFNTSQCQTCHPGGLLPSHKWSADHAVEARRNLQACQSCHSGGDVCLTCHSAQTGLRVSPHPRNWNAVKGNYRDKSNKRTCLKCHTSIDPAIQ